VGFKPSQTDPTKPTPPSSQLPYRESELRDMSSKPSKPAIAIGGIVAALVGLWIAFRILRALVGLVKFVVVLGILAAIVYFAMRAFNQFKKKK
jgi:ABC-type branched-subunit amino acid transport system permease subunit